MSDITLTSNQKRLILAAAQRPKCDLLPPPAQVRARGATLEASLNRLIDAGLARKTGRKGHERVVLTAAGRARAAPGDPRPTGKLGRLLHEIEAGGAAISELEHALGWRPHTIRAAITRLRQRGYRIMLEGELGARRYCLAMQ